MKESLIILGVAVSASVAFSMVVLSLVVRVV